MIGANPASIVTVQCVTCRKQRRPLDCEAVTIGSDTSFVCHFCIDETASMPGRMEGIHESDLPLALVLDYLAGISMEDYFLSDEGWGYAGVFDRHILTIDCRGFYDVTSFQTHDLAMREVNAMEDDGMGASDEDAYISYGNHGIEVSLAGKHLGTFTTERRARAAVSVAMRKEGFYPNVWLTGEHGPTIRRIEVW